MCDFNHPSMSMTFVSNLKGCMCGTVGLICFHALKCRWPLQDLDHVIPGIPAICDVICLLLCLGHRLLPVLDKAVLWGHGMWSSTHSRWQWLGNQTERWTDLWRLTLGTNDKQGWWDGLLRKVAWLKFAGHFHVITVLPLVMQPLRDLELTPFLHLAKPSQFGFESILFLGGLNMTGAPRWLTTFLYQHKHQSCVGVKT